MTFNAIPIKFAWFDQSLVIIVTSLMSTSSSFYSWITYSRDIRALTQLRNKALANTVLNTTVSTTMPSHLTVPKQLDSMQIDVCRNFFIMHGCYFRKFLCGFSNGMKCSASRDMLLNTCSMGIACIFKASAPLRPGSVP